MVSLREQFFDLFDFVTLALDNLVCEAHPGSAIIELLLNCVKQFLVHISFSFIPESNLVLLLIQFMVPISICSKGGHYFQMYIVFILYFAVISVYCVQLFPQVLGP